jgi:hypothetical protein
MLAVDEGNGRGKTMKSRALAFAALAAVASLCLAHPAYGQDDVTVNFSGGGSTTWIGPNPDGSGNIDVYAGIYNGTVSGIPGANPGIICDDYQDSVTAGETWTATALNAASLNSSNIDQTLFGATIGLEGYAEVATLVSYMFNGKSGYTQAELSSAIWYITSVGNASLSANLWNALDASAQALVKSLQKEFGGNLSAAEAALAGFSNLWVLTPSPEGAGEPQEMWVSAAEGGAAALYLLFAAFSCCGALYLKRRRQPAFQQAP